MKRLLINLSIIIYSLSFSSLAAQTDISKYRPGVTPEGAIYYLPKTAVRVTLLVEKTTFTPGDFALYSNRYLRIAAETEAQTTFRVVNIKMHTIGVADTSKCFAVKFNAKTAASNIQLTDNGVLLAINASGKTQEEPIPFVPARKPKKTNPRDYMNPEILAAGSKAKMAELTAQDIYEIRESRNLLSRGQADNMPKDGEQLRLMFASMDAQEQALTSMFTGTTEKDTIETTVTVSPDKELKKTVLFRLSQKLGIVDADDLSGVPYYISIENLHTVPTPVVDPKAKPKIHEEGIYVNVPGKAHASVTRGAETLVEMDFPAGQFGNVELLSGDLFNKRFTTQLTLSPVTGGIEKLKAEQPK